MAHPAPDRGEGGRIELRSDGSDVVPNPIVASTTTQETTVDQPVTGGKPPRPAKHPRPTGTITSDQHSHETMNQDHPPQPSQQPQVDPAIQNSRDPVVDSTQAAPVVSVGETSSSSVNTPPAPARTDPTAPNTSTTVNSGASTVDEKQVTRDATSSTSPTAAAAPRTTTTPGHNPSRSTTAAGKQTTPAQARKSTTTTSKRKGGAFASLFACFGCGSASAFDDDHNKNTRPARQADNKAAASAVSTTEKQQDQAQQNTPSTGKEVDSGSAALNEKVNVVSEDSTTASTTKTDSASTPIVVVPNSADGNTTAAVTDTTREDAEYAVAPLPSSAGGVALPPDETEGVTSGAVVPPGATPMPVKTKRRKSGKTGPESLITQVPEPGQRQAAIVQDSDEEETDDSDEEEEEEEDEDEEQNLIARGGVGIPIGEDGLPHPLLDDLAPELSGRKCLVLDLDETLVHSSFKMVHQADYVVPVEIENQYHNVYVIKRPGVDAFLKAMGEIYEIVIFTASLSKYADPVLDQLDVHRVVQHRLFRESCYNNKGTYVKDLSQLGRPMRDCIIIDNSPASYVFHVNNAVPISSWFNDPHDTELTDLVPFLTDLHQVDDIRSVLDAGLYQHLSFD